MLTGHRPRVTNIRGPLTSMALGLTDEEEIGRLIRKLNSKKTCDIDGMSVWLPKRCYKHILTPLTKLINLSLETGIFPNSLKTAKVIPVFKKNDPCQASNYRPISILPVLSKIYEKVFLERLLSFFENFDILDEEQFGFRKNKSTIDAVTKLMDTVVEGLDRREHVLSIFLDLSKAFDCVHHETLLHQLDACGVRGLPHKWLTSYLQGREQCVQISDITSNKNIMTHGVPQGSILGPVLFLVYVNNLNSVVQNGQVIQYADDTTLCFSDRVLNNLKVKSFVELNTCIQYFPELNLKTNQSKSNVINFYLLQLEHRRKPFIMVDDGLLEATESTKFLGIFLDQGLTWDKHIDHICSRVTSGIFALRKLANVCTLEVLKMAYYGLVHPHLSYGIRLWGGCALNKLNRIFRLQKKAVRVILKLKLKESCRQAFSELGFLTLPCLYVLDVILYCRTKCALLRGGDVHHYDTRGRDNLRVQHHRTAAFSLLPSQVGVRMINGLPESVKQITNLVKFKSRLKRHLVSNAFYSVDEFMTGRWES